MKIVEYYKWVGDDGIELMMVKGSIKRKIYQAIEANDLEVKPNCRIGPKEEE